MGVNSMKLSALGSLGLLLSGFTLATAAAAAGLESVATNWPDLGLQAALAAPANPQVEQGSDLQIRLSSRQTASVTIAMEDSAHHVRLHPLNRPDSADQLVPGTQMLYPDLGYGETLYADLPVGAATVWVIATDRTLFPPNTDQAHTTQPLVDAGALERQISDARARGLVSTVAVERIALEVIAPPVKDFVSKQDFVSFYAVRTRSVTNADRGFRIGFKTNSAELDDWSKRQLEAVGEGMRDPQLQTYRFALEGYTDDTGTEAYNKALSERRAQTVRDFLSKQMGVPGVRLDAAGFGSTRPAVKGTDSEARAQNRRVVIRRLDSASDR